VTYIGDQKMSENANENVFGLFEDFMNRLSTMARNTISGAYSKVQDSFENTRERVTDTYDKINSYAGEASNPYTRYGSLIVAPVGIGLAINGYEKLRENVEGEDTSNKIKRKVRGVLEMTAGTAATLFSGLVLYNWARENEKTEA
jgi:hypothetical protein